jgi:hypothetical protein
MDDRNYPMADRNYPMDDRNYPMAKHFETKMIVLIKAAIEKKAAKESVNGNQNATKK